MFSVATAVTTVFTLTGPQDRLRQIAEERAYRTCAPDQMAWENDTTLVMTLENGIGTSFLRHGDGLSDEYPDVSIRGMEYFDCFDDPGFAKWQGGQLVYEADLITVFGILFPTDASKDWPGCSASFWHRSPPLTAAIAENCPDFDLMPLRQLAGPAPGWVQTSDGFATLFLRLPSASDARDGAAVIFYHGLGRATLLKNVDRFGGFARYRRVSYGRITGQYQELRPVLRDGWKADEKKRRKARQERKVLRRKTRKAGREGKNSLFHLFDTDPWVI
ncbi:hypothetical protein [Gluconobacter albidus]|uniref:Uncharacterized protein n=1 Tax=Gluconobacter albidus TaxID=318683 RepID=A0AAW3R0E4_9PROT|nr:hypothetical protein [Gluconobacter albidus]KXV41440.1 hypothetical protein AD941_03170 [Gluconobacter albidus]GBQ94232.1 hypothetical protein AA3250_3006 [Gluconobacter albidus NBRC 3250]GLQ68491.1 hypothetical protein GCM10007866_09400 [Gluconobacter albidus]